MQTHQATFLVNLLSLALTLTFSSSGWGKDRFAVLELTGESQLDIDQRMYLSDLIRAEATLLIGDRYQVMTRETISELTNTEEMLRAFESGREINVGRALRAQWLMSGAVLGDERLTRVILKLHDVRREVSIDIEFAQGQTLAELKPAIKEASGRLLAHLISDQGEGELAKIDLPSATLPEAFELSASDTLGLPLPLLKRYDEALVIDESKARSLEEKIEVWSKLSRYQKYHKLQSEARRRLAYWQQRFKRRMQCNHTWKQLEQVLNLRRAISEEKKSALVESFLEACGRDLHENPHLNAPYFVERRRAEERRAAAIEAEVAKAEAQQRRDEERAAQKSAVEEARVKRRSAQLSSKIKREYSLLETHIGGGYQLNAGSFSSYHLRARLQPHSWWSRRIFLDAETSFSRVESLTRAEATWSGEWSAAIGAQLLNNTKWTPSLSAGYQHRSGEHRLIGELALRYQYIPDWLNFHLGLQYLHLASPERSHSIPRGRLPRTPLLDGTPHEMRLTLWASTGTLGISLVLLAIYGLSHL